MNKKYISWVFLLLLFISCNNTNQKIDASVYEKAAKHLPQNLNKFVTNTIISQNWDNNVLNYKTKNDTVFKSFLINVNDLEIKEGELPSTNSPRRNYQEFTSPDGKKSIYIKDYNLWVRNLITKKTKQLTFDGYEDYGYGINNAGWIKNDRPVLKWSPDSNTITTFRQDARGVGEMYLATTNVGHPKLEKWKYTLPGDEKIFEIERIFINVKSGKITNFKMGRDYQRSTTTDHIADWDGTLLDANFSSDSKKLAFVSSTRDHKEAHLKIADVKSGNIKSIHKEITKTYYESGVSGENWRVFFDSNEFLWYSEKDNWGHLYLHDLKTGKLKNRITKGDWLVRDVLHVDESSREIFFTGGGKEEGNPYHIYLYKVNFDGSGLICLTTEKGSHSINPSDNWDYFTTTYSSTENPPVTLLKNRDGKTLKEINRVDISQLINNNWQKPIEFSVKARDNETDLYGILHLPSFYNVKDKYPVLNYIYPGPQAGSVRNYSFSSTRRDFQSLAELGFVVVALDAMGTPGRSKSFHDAYYGNMGDNGLPDNIKAIKDLSKQYKGMDIERVGIWGHSGGGFASTRAILEYPDFYDVAVSSAGNHDNRNYEADWGEKWQGLLENIDIDDNERPNDYDFTKTNYDNQANQLLAKNLKGKLLLAHGNLDNNVPPYNTLLVVEELIKANKDFDLIIFPNKRHGFGDQSDYFMRRKWDYFVKHLKGLNPPSNFSLTF
jgi:dipeptidyl aminopeptidase/acylaminoacyl peptidase